MKTNRLISDLNETQIDELLKYAPSYSEGNDKNIMNRFIEKTSGIKKKHTKKKPLIVGAMAASLLFSAGLGYANSDKLTTIYHGIFGEGGTSYISQYGTVLNSEVEHDGIQLRLVSVIHNPSDHVMVFFTLTDKTEDRLSKTTKLHANYGWDNLDYDPATKTITYLANIIGEQNQTMTFSIHSITTDNGKKYNGNWSVKFKVPAQVKNLEIVANNNFSLHNGAHVKFDKVSLDPLGLEINFHTLSSTESINRDSWEDWDSWRNNTFVTYKDGSTLNLYAYMANNNRVVFSTGPRANRKVIDLKNVAFITIENQKIPVSNK
ncbi:DUF4179 domain-containing protein [Neobacillus novalis]|uniref:DUF4179 domain-containing protein n=1 Tax=Neobacillus novalis TaxID=220687 RepID=A0AA95MQ55_9BACI|nr:MULTISPECIES: DUF4179 domain-containing protein [Neobacillus]WHY84663.1 DUF4179 domain-containing protein [Neobacillus novalis]